MKKIYKYLVCFLLILGCNDNNNLLEDIAVRGGYVQFVEVPNLNFNIFKLGSGAIIADLVDPNANVINYSLSAIFEGNIANNVVEITSFPAKLELSLSTILNALGITEDDLEGGSAITLVATITTPTGVFTGLSPNYDTNNVNQGGNTTVRLKSNGLNDAVEFDVTFFIPPPKTIRKTSFEEVAIGAVDDTYERNGAANETIDLINGASPPFVDYTAVGSSVSNEIGFNTEYFAVENISSSGLGFTRERLGVFSLLEDYPAYPDGTQGYHIEDPDGGLRITFDTVEVPVGQEKSGIRFAVYFGETSWESRDGMYAFVNITTDAGSEVIEMVNLFDDDVEDIAGSWVIFDTDFLTGVRSYQLIIEASSGATPESFDIDNVIVYESED